MNNGVINGLKYKKENKACKTALYGKINERREAKGEWSIGVHTQNVLYFSIVTTQHKTRLRHVRCLLMRVKARRRALIVGKAHRHESRVLMMDNARRREETQGAQFSKLIL